MGNRPIIILGDGLWGKLLTYRLSQCLPMVKFRLCTTSASSTEGNSWSFRECEMDLENLKWIEPFISYRWKSHRVISHGLDRIFNRSYSVILPGQFENMTRKFQSEEKLDPAVTMEELLEQSAFVIDTRPDPQQRRKCTRQTFGMIVELSGQHELAVPISMDGSVPQKGILRHLQYLPINPYTLLVKDVRFSKELAFDVHQREEELLWEIRKKWKVSDVVHREVESVPIPSGKIRSSNDGRVISLAGLLNPVTGDQFVEAVKVVNIMVKTSFRIGELKEVIQRYRMEKEKTKRLSRLIIKMLYYSPHPGHRIQLLERLFKLPAPVVENFLQGNLGFMDIGKSLLRYSPFPIVKVMAFKLSSKSTKIREPTTLPSPTARNY